MNAQARLGFLYLRGGPVAQDYVDAVKWLTLAGMQGDRESQRELGRCYLRGDGVKKDEIEAYAWFALTIVRTKDGARVPVSGDAWDELETLEKAFTPDAKLRANQRASALAARVSR